MFRKDFKVKNNVKSKNSEKRKIIDDICRFYCINQSSIMNIIGKSDLYKIKVECHDNTIITIFNFDDQPLFFEVNKIMIPTVYCLWLINNILPSFTIHEETVSFIENGSDLMIPGIIVKKPLNEKSYGIFQKGDIYSINTNFSRAPVAIGLTNMDSYDMFMSGGRGKALNMLHVQGDYLWAFGKKTDRPQIYWIEENIENKILSVELSEIQVDDQLRKENKIIDKFKNIPEFVSQSNDFKNEAIEMDELLELCFLHAIKCSIKEKSLPITLNMLYGNHVLRFCPKNMNLDIKKTSFKKFGVFMKKMASLGIVTLKEISKGVEAVTEIVRNHEKLRFTPSLVFQEEKIESSSDSEYVFPQIDEILFITDKLYNMFKFFGYKKSDIIYPKEVKSIVTEYVNKHNLNGINKDMVTLDDLLKSSCLNSKETVTQLSWKTLFERINKNLTPGIVLKFPNENITLKNSKKPKIKIQSFNRNNKMVTRIEGENQFCIDNKKFCFLIQQSIGCSCGLVTDKSGITAIQAQGDQTQRIMDILMEHFKVPQTFIEADVTKKTKK